MKNKKDEQMGMQEAEQIGLDDVGLDKEDREARKTAQAVPPEPSEAPAEPPQMEKTE